MLKEAKDTEKNMMELKTNVEKWCKEHDKMKGNELKEQSRTLVEIKVLKEEVSQLREEQMTTLSNEQDISGGNNVLDHIEIHELRAELVKLKDKQLGDHVNQRADSPL